MPSPKKELFYFIGYQYSPYLARQIIANAVISEPPVNLWQRTLDQLVGGLSQDTFAITFAQPIDRVTYERGRVHNPLLRGDYVAISEQDARDKVRK